jgi:hypothetical protein
MIRRLAYLLGIAALAAAMMVPLYASAQEYPPPPPPGQQGPPNPPPPNGPPPNAPGPYGPSQGYGGGYSAYHLRGVIQYWRPYFFVIDVNGRRVAVHEHVGTVILPTGLSLVPGMEVGINGYWVRGGWYNPYNATSFVADRIILLR